MAEKEQKKPKGEFTWLEDAVHGRIKATPTHWDALLQIGEDWTAIYVSDLQRGEERKGLKISRQVINTLCKRGWVEQEWAEDVMLVRKTKLGAGVKPSEKRKKIDRKDIKGIHKL